MATLDLYKKSTIWKCLEETLDEMVVSGVVSPELALQVAVQFSKSMTEAFKTQVKTEVSIKGRLYPYRNCFDFWAFNVKDAVFKIEECESKKKRKKSEGWVEIVGRVKIEGYVSNNVGSRKRKGKRAA